MLDAVLGGEADATVFADRARGQPRATLPALQQALVGRVKPHHLIVIGQILAHIDVLDQAIDHLHTAIADASPGRRGRGHHADRPQHQSGRRRCPDRRDRRRHEPVSLSQAPDLVGRRLSGQQVERGAVSIARIERYHIKRLQHLGYTVSRAPKEAA